ncbi:MAG: lamin tail domain-containing protein [Sumerlaeia bacterium]
MSATTPPIFLLLAALSLSSAAPAQILINEVLPSNDTGLTDENGDRDDWIELYNAGSQEIGLSGYSLTDDLSQPRLFSFPAGTRIAAKGHLLVWADDEPLQGELHAPFRLRADGETVFLFGPDAVEADRMVFPPLGDDIAYGRFPDGAAATNCTETPTPLAPNAQRFGPGCGELRQPPRVVINEFMASNQSTITDEGGEFADWIELHNLASEPLDVSGFFVSDDPDTEPQKFELPAGTVIPAGGYLLLWADNDVLQGPLHTGFGLSANGESIGLFDRAEFQVQLIDVVTFGAQTADISEGRVPNGTGDFEPLPKPSPRKNNTPPTGWEAR